ncbi:MAG: hypothetical protein RLZZ319_638 [Actinomycetota bacterium]
MNPPTRLNLKNVNSGLGPTLTFIVAGLLWLVYLAPGLRDRHEERMVERNARRINATSETLGIRPSTPLREMSTQEIVLHRREMERLARMTERQSRDAERREIYAAAPRAAEQFRSVKLGLTALIVATILTGVGFGLNANWAYVAIAGGVAVLAVIGLVSVNSAPVRASAPVRTAAPRPARNPKPDATWTPVRVPPVRTPMPEGAGLIVTDDHAKAVAARERAERIRQQAALAAASEGRVTAAPDPRFTEPVAPAAPAASTDADTGSFDINAALRARRAN